MDNQAKISLNVHGMSLEITGSEQFVSEQIEHFRSAIQSALEEAPPEEKTPSEADIEPPPAPHKEPTGEPKYTNALHVDGQKVSILKKVAGSTKSKRAVNSALVYLWAKRNAGVDSVPFGELRELCKNQDCLDKPNFAKNMRSAREWIVIEGTRKSETAKLTMLGVEQAALLQKLNADKGAQDS